jgi:hypothetical protein
MCTIAIWTALSTSWPKPPQDASGSEPLLFHLAGIPSYLVVAELALCKVLCGRLEQPKQEVLGIGKDSTG